MSKTQTNYFIVALVFSILSAALVLLTDFAGWTEPTYYGYNDYFVFIGSENAPLLSQILLIVIGGSLVAISYYSYMGLQENISQQDLENAYRLNLAIIVSIILGALVFFILAADATAAWLDVGFYGGLIGSAVSFAFIRLAKQDMGL